MTFASPQIPLCFGGIERGIGNQAGCGTHRVDAAHRLNPHAQRPSAKQALGMLSIQGWGPGE